MPALNRVQLIGNLGKEPQTRYTPVAAKSARSAWRSTAAGGAKMGDQRINRLFNVEAWVGPARSARLPSQGSLVYIEGRLKTDRYEHEGNPLFYKGDYPAVQLLDRRAEEEPVEEIEEPPPA